MKGSDHIFLMQERAIEQLKRRLNATTAARKGLYSRMLSEAHIVSQLVHLPNGTGLIFVAGDNLFRTAGLRFLKPQSPVRRSRYLDDFVPGLNRRPNYGRNKIAEFLPIAVYPLNLAATAYTLADMAYAGAKFARIRIADSEICLRESTLGHDPQADEVRVEVVDLSSISNPADAIELLVRNHGFREDHTGADNGYLQVLEQHTDYMTQRFVVHNNRIIEAFPPSRQVWQIDEETPDFSDIVDHVLFNRDGVKMAQQRNSVDAEALKKHAEQLVKTNYFYNKPLMAFDVLLVNGRTLISDPIYVTAPHETRINLRSLGRSIDEFLALIREEFWQSAEEKNASFRMNEETSAPFNRKRSDEVLSRFLFNEKAAAVLSRSNFQLESVKSAALIWLEGLDTRSESLAWPHFRLPTTRPRGEIYDV